MDDDQHHQRCALRGTWQLASVFHFLNVFRPVLDFNLKFSMEDLENALLSPNDLLRDIHIGLLKAIPPSIKTPITRETWKAALHRKLKEWWHAVAEGPFPLASQDGDEMMTYEYLNPNVRALILKALCEARLDQEDTRAFISEMAKEKTTFMSIRKERTGTDIQGATYWYESDPVAGYRLYREPQSFKGNEKAKLRAGKMGPAPASIHWETVATNLDEFQSVAERLCSSKNEVELVLGNKINSDIVPELINAEKRKQRVLQKQLREASLLDSDLNVDSIACSRPRRDLKPVSYTFDDYDNSITEAIDWMKGIPATREITDDTSSMSQDEEEEGTAGGEGHKIDTHSQDSASQSSKSEACSDDFSSRHVIDAKIKFDNTTQCNIDTSSECNPYKRQKAGSLDACHFQTNYKTDNEDGGVWDEKENLVIVMDFEPALSNGSGPLSVTENPKGTLAQSPRATRSKTAKHENHIWDALEVEADQNDSFINRRRLEGE